jgi:hypothetical protein
MMRTSKRNAWRGIALSLGLACLLGILVYVTLTGLSTATADEGSDWPSLPPTLLNDTDTYTTFLPATFKHWCTYHSTRPPLQGTANFPGEVEILTPPNWTTGIPAESRVSATGTYSGTPVTATLWILAYSPEGLYYPQSPDACDGEPPTQVGGHWQVPLYLGKTGGPPEWFDIVAILTDHVASQFLGEWLREGCAEGEYEGISAELLGPMAITEKAYISVQTAD